MADILRGTVYVIVEGVPVDRRVLEISGAENERAFKHEAATELSIVLNVTGASLEFGPIGPPWGPPHA